MKYMLDTNVCIDLIRSRPRAVIDRIKEHISDGLCISSITLAELEHGVEKSMHKEHNRVALLKMLTIFKILPFDDGAAEAYGHIRAALESWSEQIGPMDMLIAAHAKAEELVLVTNNIREFARVDGLAVENWHDASH